MGTFRGRKVRIDGKVWNGSNWIRRAKRLWIYERDSYTCVWCGRTREQLDELNILCLDHLTPRVRSGSHRTANLVTSCRRCNSARSQRSVARWLRWLERADFDMEAIAARLEVAITTPYHRDERRCAGLVYRPRTIAPVQETPF
jgi:5-methylcytosine-specific restriction endonuclease McrA